MFSDGRATFPVEEFTQRNKNEVIVFSFIVDVYGDEEDLKALACNNNGMKHHNHDYQLRMNGI